MINLTVNQGDVIRTISPNDEMFSAAGREDVYHAIGRSAIECIVCSLNAARKTTADVKRILDLPSGHGRVLRYLKAVFPDAEITACDLVRDGVDFCASALGALPV